MTPTMIDAFLAAWRINNRINLRLIDRISDVGMRCTLSQRGGRSVVRQFAHLHYVRVYQPQKRAKPLARGAEVFATHDEPDRRTLAAALEDSSHRVEEWLRQASQGAPGVRAFARRLVPALGYLIAHESNHRGNILLTLKQCGQGRSSAAIRSTRRLAMPSGIGTESETRCRWPGACT